MEAIYILWLRQLKRYFRSRARVVGALGQPLLYLVALGYGLGTVYQRAGQGNYIAFLVPGIIAQSILFTSMFAGIEVIWDKQFGYLKETLVAPVPRFTVILGRTLGGATVATFQGMIVLALSHFLGFRAASPLWLTAAVVTMGIVALLFTSLGTAVACKLDDMQGFQLIMNFLVMPLFFLSGAIFPLNAAPPWLRRVAECNPLTYGVDALRAFLIGTAHFPLALDLGVLAVVTALMLGLASAAFARIEG